MSEWASTPASAPADVARVGASMGIGAVERDTGLSKDTLRIWERRYQFPVPGRDAFGERVYPSDQVDKLRLIKRLMDQGMRPGKLMHHSVEELRALRQSHVSVAPESPELLILIDLVRRHRIDEFRTALGQQVVRLGLARFVIEVVAPLNNAVGEAWVGGELAIFEEHLYTESVKVVLRNAIASVPRHRGTPRVLLTTFPREEHALGLLMVEAVLALEGAHCVSLGVETPLPEIVRAARSQQADIIALSFSAAYGSGGLAEGLAELRAALPRGVELWAGGAGTLQLRKAPEGVVLMRNLDAVTARLSSWRTDHATA